MAYSEKLADRVRDALGDRHDVREQKMFGGLCFMVKNHMCCGIVEDRLMVRIGADNYATYLAKPHAEEMTFTGRALKGMLYVNPPGISRKPQLQKWVTVCLDFVETLPPKKKKPKKKKRPIKPPA